MERNGFGGSSSHEHPEIAGQGNQGQVDGNRQDITTQTLERSRESGGHPAEEVRDSEQEPVARPPIFEGVVDVEKYPAAGA